MITELEIFNAALGYVGAQRLSGLTGTDKRQEAYQIYYEMTLGSVILDIRPRFAVKYEELNLIADISIPGYDYVYQQPGDLLQVISVTDDAGDKSGTSKTEDGTAYKWATFRVGSISKNVIGANFEDAYCEFYSSVREVSMYDADFKKALAYKLAAEIDSFLNGAPKNVQLNLGLYEAEAMKAKSRNLTKSRITMPGYQGFSAIRQ